MSNYVRGCCDVCERERQKYVPVGTSGSVRHSWRGKCPTARPMPALASPPTQQSIRGSFFFSSGLVQGAQERVFPQD